MKTAIIVPARLASARFPRKLLHEVRGKPLIVWVAERISKQTPQFPLHFAVDGDELRDVLTAAGFNALPTNPAHASGTDRVAEANAVIGADIVINIQADEPLVTAKQIETLAGLVAEDCPMATLATAFSRADDFLNPNQVKVVISHAGRALYFSRSTIPYPRESAGEVTAGWLKECKVYRHLGLYAYRSNFLEVFSRLPPGRLEAIERLEQLRALENGYAIAVGITNEPTIGVDTLEDAEAFERHIDSKTADG